MTTAAPMSISAALVDRQLLGAALGDPASWSGWVAILRAAFGLSLTPTQSKFFASVAGDRKPPEKRCQEAWFVVGRRSGKSRMAAAVAVFLACFRQYRLSAGETGFVLVLAASRDQARAVFDYCRGFLEASPILRQLIIDVTADEIRLKGNVIIAVHTNSYRTVRGKTLLAAIFDEVSFWRSEDSSQPDFEVARAVRPALAASRGLLCAISSPYATRGLLYERFRDHFGHDSDVLVIKAASRQLNPLLDQEMIDAAVRDDAEAARAEFLGEFRGDLALYISRAVLERCIEPGVYERPPGIKWRYTAFVDPSGGAHDSMTLAIAHRDGDRVILDAVRETRAPFEPAECVSDFTRVCKAYRVTTVRGDRYSGDWVAAAFRVHGITYKPCEQAKSEIYLDCLPLFTNGTALLLDNPRLIAQLSQLERRTSRIGRDAVDHMRGCHDDLANAVCGALTHTPTRSEAIDVSRLQRKAITSNRPKLWQRERPEFGFLRRKPGMYD